VGLRLKRYTICWFNLTRTRLHQSEFKCYWWYYCWLDLLVQDKSQKCVWLGTPFTSSLHQSCRRPCL